MVITPNDKETETVVYDKANLIYALPRDIVPLVIKPYNTIKAHVIKIIANSINMSDSEKDIYDLLVTYYNTIEGVGIKDIISNACKFNNKSNMTYKRAIEGLIHKRVIRRNYKLGLIYLNNNYYIKDVNEDAKYIVIEVRR